MLAVMTVAELIHHLSQLPSDLQVIMSKDGEGNGFSPLHEAEEGNYIAVSGWSGEIVDDEDVPEYDETTIQRVVFLWPVN